MKTSLVGQEFDQIDFSYLEALVTKYQLSPALAQNLVNYWEMRIKDPRDSIYHHYFEYYLFFESIQSGIILVFIYEKHTKKVLHQYGILVGAIPEIIRQTQEEIDDGSISETQSFFFHEHHFQLWRRFIRYHDHELYLCAVLPPGPLNRDKLHRLYKIFLRYYLPESLYPDRRFLEFFPSLNQEICEKTAPALQSGRAVTFTYFRFEDLNKYIVLGGESFGEFLVNGIRDEITARLKHEDSIYILSPRDYLIVSLNCEKEIMERRFYRMIFQLRSLILSYRVKYTTYKAPIRDLTFAWKDIAILE
ncbi:MAG: hypothetical protein NZM25_02230 [Leptospiraceae bacterium]|nr:hypothetical protein [Leptospiraceae bacterium]MDW8306995.1 hypothetical protein [Leptospiraceae bacterium]